MVKRKFGFSLEYVADVDEARRFYADAMGLVVQREHPTFVQFENFAIADDESLSGTRDPELYGLVDDAEAALQELKKGVEVTVPLRQRPFGKVFGIKNTTGRTCFILELAKDRPSKPGRPSRATALRRPSRSRDTDAQSARHRPLHAETCRRDRSRLGHRRFSGGAWW